MNKTQLTEIIREVLAETIRKVDGEYVVYPKKGGKRLGTHTSYEKALNQLKAIEASKHEVVEPADEDTVNMLQLAAGIGVELEHTDDRREATKIALQHLAEDPFYYSKLLKAGLEEGPHDPMNPGILKQRLGSLSCSKVRAARGKLKDKGTTYAKALQRYLNYHCQ